QMHTGSTTRFKGTATKRSMLTFLRDIERRKLSTGGGQCGDTARRSVSRNLSTLSSMMACAETCVFGSRPAGCSATERLFDLWQPRELRFVTPVKVGGNRQPIRLLQPGSSAA